MKKIANTLEIFTSVHVIHILPNACSLFSVVFDPSICSFTFWISYRPDSIDSATNYTNIVIGRS